MKLKKITILNNTKKFEKNNKIKKDYKINLSIT